MSRGRYFVLAAAMLGVLLLATTVKAHGPEGVLRIVVLPCSNVVRTYERFQPLLNYLAEATGHKFEARYPKSEKELIDLVKGNAADFIFHAPHILPELADFLDTDNLIQSLTETGETSKTGIIVVREDSGIKSMQDLRGKDVLLGMQCSSGQMRAALNLFKQHGIDLDKDLHSYAQGGCCEDIAFNVSLGAADAGMICSLFFKEYQGKKKDISKRLVKIAETGPLATRVFAAHRNTDKNIAASVVQALLEMKQSDPRHVSVLKMVEVGGFVGVGPEIIDAPLTTSGESPAAR